MDLYLDPATHDLDITGHRVRTTNGQLETVRQELAIELQTFLGEWFLDQSLGVPYFRDILVKNPNLSIIANIFRRKILANPNVDSIPRLELDLDSDRRLLVSFDAVLLEGTLVTVSLPAPEPELDLDTFLDQFGNTILDEFGDLVING